MGRTRLVRCPAAARNHEHVPAGFIRAGLQRELDAASTAERGTLVLSCPVPSEYFEISRSRSQRNRRHRRAARCKHQQSDPGKSWSHPHHTPSSMGDEQLQRHAICAIFGVMRAPAQEYSAPMRNF